MITTIDGVVKKPGDKCYTVWFSTILMSYKPKEVIFDEHSTRYQFDDLELCKEQCRLMNKK